MVSMMRSGIIRLQEGGLPWYMSIFSTKGSGETEAEKAYTFTTRNYKRT